MKKFFLILTILSFFCVFTFAQKPKPTPRKPVVTKPKPSSADEKQAFENALAQTDAAQKISALQKFVTDFPKSAERNRALELIVSARAQSADEKLRGGDTAAGIELFKQAVTDAPAPMSDKLFSEVVLQFPTNLFFGGQPQAAVEIAKLIEEKIGNNAKQILGLATFYIGTENSVEALRLANKAIETDSKMPAAYQTLGLANRLGFRFVESVEAYAKAAELDPNSVVSKRSLAEMKRAVGKPDEAAGLYREILEKNPDDVAAQTGLALALFDSKNQTEAETETNKLLEKNPNNLPLLVGAAYWYAANNNGEKAVDFAQRAIAVEPRYTWAHIALARGLLLQNRYTTAEKELLLAQQYGNFPTLIYEIAIVRLAAGFYEEAAQELRKGFAVTNDSVKTNLGNRIPREEKGFIELLTPERSASIFEPLSADSPEVAERLKALFILNRKVFRAETTEAEIDQAVNEFVKGDDAAKTHRQLYAANLLLQANKNLLRALKLTEEAVAGVDAALQTPNAAGAIMADELAGSRRLAISRGEVIVVPDIPRQTLSAILRGRLEEIAGWTLFKQNKPEEAIVRLKRSVGVLPPKSAWWRSSMWRLGMAFDAVNKSDLALDYYIKSYVDAPPDAAKYAVIEKAYQKVNGSLEGLNKKIGEKPVDTTAATVPTPTPTVTPTPETNPTSTPTPIVEATPEQTPTPKVETTPVATPENSPLPTPSPTEPKPEITPEPSPTPTTEPSPTPKVEPTPQNSPTPEISPTPIVESTPQPSPSPSPENKTEEKSSEPTPKPSPSPSFDPVIIKVPNPETKKPEKPDSTTAQNSGQDSENKSSETQEKPKNDNSPDSSGATRPRITSAQNPETPTCQIDIGQETVSIIANGGNLGLLVGLKPEGDSSKITVSSSSPSDVNVLIDPEIGKSSNRVFFIIKSVSTKTGIFTVTFDSPCGKKELQVKVR